MIYTKKMQQAVRSIRPPHDFVVDIVEYSVDPTRPFISLRFYESQWDHYNEIERLRCIDYIEKVRNILTSFGVAVTLEPIIDTGETLPEKYRKVYNQ